jgi:hypothetical protein
VAFFEHVGNGRRGEEGREVEGIDSGEDVGCVRELRGRSGDGEGMDVGV